MLLNYVSGDSPSLALSVQSNVILLIPHS